MLTRKRKKNDRITSFLLKASLLPPVTVLDNSNNNDSTSIERFKHIDPTVFIAYLPPPPRPSSQPEPKTNETDTETDGETKADDETTNLASVFTAVAESHRNDFVFGMTFAAELAALEGLSVPAVVCYRSSNNLLLLREGEGGGGGGGGDIDIDTEAEAVTGVFTQEQLEGFVRAVGTRRRPGVIGEMTRRNMYGYILNPETPYLTYIFYPSLSSRRSLRRDLTPTASRFRAHVTFVTIDAGEYGANMAASLGLQYNQHHHRYQQQQEQEERQQQQQQLEDLFPALAVHDIVNDRVYVYPQGRAIEAEQVERMLLGVLRGEARPGVWVFDDDDDHHHHDGAVDGGDEGNERDGDGREGGEGEGQEGRERRHDEL